MYVFGSYRVNLNVFLLFVNVLIVFSNFLGMYYCKYFFFLSFFVSLCWWLFISVSFITINSGRFARSVSNIDLVFVCEIISVVCVILWLMFGK